MISKIIKKFGILTSIFFIFSSTQTVRAEKTINLFDGKSYFITNEEISAQQDTWCNAGLLAISETYHKKGWKAAKKLASEVIDAWYGYNLLPDKKVPVAFNPTWTYGDLTFRTTRRGAISYFVGRDKKFPIDPGFALGAPGPDRSQWISCKVKNAVNFAAGNVGFTMGKVYFEAEDGTKADVDKTWIFVKNPDTGEIRCVLHESATPFNPDWNSLYDWHSM